VTAARFDLPRRLLAEALGTAFLLATVVGSGIMAERLADGNVALALLANAISTGAILIVLITILGPVSGAHLNPAVSAALALRRELPPHEFILYVLAQLAGGVAGSALAHGMFELPLVQISVTTRTGAGQWLGESTAAFGLLLTILDCMRFRPAAVPWCVGLYITAAYWFTSSTSFANPTVTIARGLSDTFAGIRPADVPAFIVAQLAGALAASLLAGWLFAEPKKEQRSATATSSGAGCAARVDEASGTG
jgi:glycerol uptake facilitator-like aquaporin